MKESLSSTISIMVSEEEEGIATKGYVGKPTAQKLW